MYEKPNLNRVGNAQDVILGNYINGSDLDFTYYPEDDFAFDEE